MLRATASGDLSVAEQLGRRVADELLQHDADVAAAEPAVLGERLGGRVGEVVVAVHDVRALDLDLVALTQADLAAREHLAHGAELVGVGAVDERTG